MINRFCMLTLIVGLLPDLPGSVYAVVQDDGWAAWPELQLVGIVHASDGGRDAYIRYDKQVRIYKAGNCITGSICLRRIGRVYAVLGDGESVHRIYLEYHSPLAADVSPPAPLAKRRTAAGDKSERVIKIPGRKHDIVRQHQDNLFEIDRQYFQQLFTQNRLFRHIDVAPAHDKEIEITRIVPGSFFNRSGLQVRDIIVGVNGVPLTDLRQLYDASNEHPEQVVELKLRRGGETRYLFYKFSGDMLSN